MLTKKQEEAVTAAAKDKHVSGLYTDTSMSDWSWVLRGTEKTPSRNGKWLRTSTFHVLSVTQPDVDPIHQEYIKAKEKFVCKVEAAQALFKLMRER